MFLEKVDVIITILAALMVAVVSFVSGAYLSDLVLRLVVTIIIFYIIGFFIKMYLLSDVFKTTDYTDETEIQEGFAGNENQPEEISGETSEAIQDIKGNEFEDNMDEEITDKAEKK